MKTCTNCAAEVHDGANFCNMCGGSSFAKPIPEEPVLPETLPEEAVSRQSIPEEILLPELNDPALPDVEPSEPLPVAEESEDLPQELSESIPEEPEEPSPICVPILDDINYYTDAGMMPTPSRKHSKIVIAGAAALVAAIVLIIILANPQRRLMNAIRSGDSLTAGELYHSALAGSEKKKAKADARLDAYVGQQLELYLNREIGYDALLDSLQTISAAAIENEKLPNALAQAEAVNFQRETFAAAGEAFDAGDYAAAIDLYTQVAQAGGEHSENAAVKREEAVLLYRAAVLESVTAFNAANEFGRSYTVIREALALLPGDDVVEEIYLDCIQAHHDYTMDGILAEVHASCDSGDYLGALAQLDSLIAEYPDDVRLQKERDDCVAAYEEHVFNEVYRLAAEENYSDAAALAAQGLGIFESQRVAELQQICLSHIPVNLGDMEIASNDTVGGVWNTHTLKIDEYLEDRYGGTYSHSLSVGCGTLTYQVGHRYDTFTGVVAFPKGLTSNAAKKSATLSIYGDGTQLAVFKNFSSGSMPMALNLDISGYETITLEWTCKGYNTWLDWGDFATIFDGVLTPIPQELSDGVG
ncbi:MAG: NPCBM/NEW2 domain-containing protein [Oscillospiraceae bacterium]|nr:NPCBM/NEW2 domain-containing protein [Oscillospiraceae bacterium]